MIVGIDASNIRAGGGVTHLKELLDNSAPSNYSIEKIIVFSSSKTLKQLKDQEWLIKITHPLINKSLFYIILWQQVYLKKMLHKYHCDILFCPAGTYVGDFRPFIAMSQNMLIFEKKESSRYGFSLISAKFLILNLVQSISFKNSNGVLFISNYAQKFINKSIPINAIPSCIVPHGISHRFYSQPKEQKNIASYSFNQPFKLLYISTIDFYKHQWNVAEAVYHLRESGLPIELTLIGGAYQPALKKLKHTISKFDPSNNFIRYIGFVPYNKIEAYYKEADAFIFASTCENFANILLEAMTAGLPIACSDKSVMTEILKDAGFYFDPEKVQSISIVIEKLIKSPAERKEKAKRAYQYSKEYSWQKCADETFGFIKEVSANFYKND
jgi:glycosyltransferase involved in cell wall biosynthesis